LILCKGFRIKVNLMVIMWELLTLVLVESLGKEKRCIDGKSLKIVFVVVVFFGIFFKI